MLGRSLILPSRRYDASVGDGVDADGFARLPLHKGARRIWVNSATGRDQNDGMSPTSPKASIAAGLALIPLASYQAGPAESGRGYQLMIAASTQYIEPHTFIRRQKGLSAQFPTVIQTYDPADPDNERKHGRGRARVTAPGFMIAGMNAETQCLAIRGLEWRPPPASDSNIWNQLGQCDYLLIENCILRETQLVLQCETLQHHLIVRQCAIYGAWTMRGAHMQGIFANGIDGLTIEDNVFWHNGWKPGGSRDDPVSGATMFNHAVYLSVQNFNSIIRRNLFIDPSSHGLQARGDASVYHNVFMDCPIAVLLGGGDNYGPNTAGGKVPKEGYRPNGVTSTSWGNVIVGEGDISTNLPRGCGTGSENGRYGSFVRGDIYVHGRPALGNRSPYGVSAHMDAPSHLEISDTLVYKWGTGTSSCGNNTFPTRVNKSEVANRWDREADTSNITSAGLEFNDPSRNTQAVARHFGFDNKDGLALFAIENPQIHWADEIRSWVAHGYNR
jgi:hypothetical protein